MMTTGIKGTNKAVLQGSLLGCAAPGATATDPYEVCRGMPFPHEAVCLSVSAYARGPVSR